MDRKNKVLIIRILIALVLWIIAIILNYGVSKSLTTEIIYITLYSISYIISGYDILFGAIRNILSGQLLDEYFLMSIATIGAFLMRLFGSEEYLEAVAVMIFFQVGEIFQGIAVTKSKNAIISTMKLQVNLCLLENGDSVDPNEVEIGSHIIIKPGEMVPIDGEALEDGVINQASLTGEAMDIEVSKGDIILSGSINVSKPLYIKTTKAYSDSTASKIIDMVENATMKKAKSEKFITKFARIYTPIVVGFAVILAGLVPTIIGLFTGFSYELYGNYIYSALTCLVVSCPCALVVSIPLSYFASIGANAKNKIIVKGGSYIEDLALCNTIILDKTGTLTKATFEVTNIYGNKDEVIKIAKGLEKNSTHPLALAINKMDGDTLDLEIEEHPGLGVIGKKDNDLYYCGSKSHLEKNGIKPIDVDDIGSILYVAKNNECLGAIILEDVIKTEAIDVIKKLKDNDINVVVLSGDNKNTVKKVCDKLSIDNYYSNLLPADKVNKATEIINSNDKKTIFVGDGINDAPVLALSDIGVSMGQIGSDSAIEASDIVILNDDLNALPLMLKIAKKTKRIVIENIIFILLIKLVILALCAVINIFYGGFEPLMLIAIFGDVGVCVLAVLNSMRALVIK